MGDVAIGHNDNVSLDITVYPWSSGFGTKYTNPASTEASNGHGVAFNPNGSVLGLARHDSPYMRAWPWSASGFGTAYTDPATLPGSEAHGIAWSPSGHDVAIAQFTSPYINAYPWSSGWGAKYTNPGTLPGDVGYNVAFSPDGAYVGISCNNLSLPIYVYPWSGSGFGTKVADPASPSFFDVGYGIRWAPNGNTVALRVGSNIYAWPWSAGFGSKYTNPASPLSSSTGSGNPINWSPGSDAIAYSSTTSPYVRVWPFSAGFGTKFADPGTTPTGQASGVSFSQAGTDIVVGHAVTPFVTGWPWSAGFGAKYTDPATLPQSSGLSVDFNPSSLFPPATPGGAAPCGATPIRNRRQVSGRLT